MSVSDDFADESLGLANIWIGVLKKQIGVNGKNIEKFTLRQQQEVSGLLAKLMRSSTGLIKEKRALAAAAKTAASQLSYDEKRKLIVEFITMMPAEHQAELRDELGWK